MFHAWFYLLSCVLFQLWSTFYMISWTNLLTRATVPAAYFLMFLVPGSQKMNILRIGRDKRQSYYFPGRLAEPEGESERGHTPLGTGQPRPRQGMVWAPWPATDLASFAYKSIPIAKPKSSIRNPRKVPQRRRYRRGDSGDRKSLFRHPAGTG